MIYLILVTADGIRHAFNRRYEYLSPQPSQDYLKCIGLGGANDTWKGYELYNFTGDGYWFDPPLEYSSNDPPHIPQAN